MKFEGTIVITDPCYLDSDNSILEESNWWEQSNYGENMQQFGFTSYIGEPTIIGDWSWKTINIDSNEVIGQFCADAGMVCVCLLDEVLKFNPNFEKWAKAHPWCATIIENFSGNITYVVDEEDEMLFHIIGQGTTNFTTE